LPFEIPDSWEWVRLNNIFSVINGDRGKNYPAKSTLSNKGIPFISAVNLDGKSVVNDDNLLCLSDAQYDKLGSGKLIKDDVVVCIRGSLGKHGKFPFDKGAIASSLVILRSMYNEQILSEFIMMYLDSPLFFDEIKKFDNGTAQPNLAAKSLEQFFVPLPPLAEQKRIIYQIENINSNIVEYNQKNTEIEFLQKLFPEQLKKSILQEAVQGKLVPQDPSDEPASALLERIREEKTRLIKEGKIKKDKNESVIFRRDNSYYEKSNGVERCIDDEIPFEIPDSWEWVRWGTLSYSIQYGYNAPALEKGKIKMLRISDIHDNNVIWNTVPYCEIANADIEKYSLTEGDILFARTGGTVGKSFLLTSVIEKAIYAGYLIRTRYNTKELSSKYLKYFMDSPFYWEQLRGSTVATAQPNCNGQSLAKMLLPLPPLAEQHRIVAKIEQLLAMIKGL
jgi:type I restriction enzyme S subunit